MNFLNKYDTKGNSSSIFLSGLEGENWQNTLLEIKD